MLVDDHALLRQGTRALLEAAPDIYVVAEAERGEDALNLARRLAPDVVLLDIKLQGLSGIEVARALRQDMPEIKVLMLSAYNTEQYVRALFAIGVHGYLLKSATGPQMIEAVRAVCRGETVLSAEIMSRVVGGTHRSGIAASDTLSDREREVLELVGRGASNKEIATSLALSTRTVEKHVSGAMAKLGARSRTEAINLAVQRGIIALE